MGRRRRGEGELVSDREGEIKSALYVLWKL
jgi:hypothetical protein